MKTVVADILERFLAAFPVGEEACLVVDAVSSPDAASIDRAPFWTALIRGRHDGQEGPHALVLLTVPSRAADAPEVLEFAVRRARAHKAPYFVTWTLRDAVLWRTPKPGVPVARDALEKLRDYADLYEVPQSDDPILDEATEQRVASRGADIAADMTKLWKDGSLELLPIDTYVLNRLVDAVKHLFPILSDSVHDRLLADVGFRARFSAWVPQPAIQGAPSDRGFANSITEHILFFLLLKVLLYQTLRHSVARLPKLDIEGADTAEVLPRLRAAFAEARELDFDALAAPSIGQAFARRLGIDGDALKIDYRWAFEESLPDQIAWPANASRELAALLRDLSARDFRDLSKEFIVMIAWKVLVRRNKRRYRIRGTREEEEAAEHVVAELLPHGSRRFPDEFLFGAETVATTIRDLPEQSLICEEGPFFTGVRTADSSFKLPLKPFEARYLWYAQRAGMRAVRVPEKTVAVRRAVADYEKYLRELHEQLYGAYLRRTFNARDAERLTQAAFDRFRLPTPRVIG